ncbi:hypothetical protein TBR22_A19240 [Luteitalea sp. TBR-22]|uniref:hypothetical protein n=1 Tax=Luteitalea sp. TBR-22 TaxID=2802971 RepID=UPI001AF611DD|nr:hypothetical protein [Luteitalea sp. TBR-22]BCS32702.1 hypothetical protein TBR22_A19240 [Luteitalea sp. TBR-22]
MRALVPLLTAAALALGGWLATGTVTVRSLDAPARIGLIGPPSAFLSFLLPLLALSAIGLARGSRSPGPLVALALVSPVVLPWLPLPIPAAWLAWTGPLAVGWWLACVTYVHADAFRLLARPLGGMLGAPTRAPWFAAAVTGVALLATAWHTAPQHPKGDEPDYLVITQSLLLDRDLRIEDNHARADYATYHPRPLPPSYLARGTDGQIYSVHAPGLPALLVPGFAVAGYRGAVATLVLFAMFGAWLAWRVSWQVTGDVTASWVATLATVGAAPFFLHGAAIFPDAPASALALLAIGVLLREAVSSGGPGSAARPSAAPWALASLALGLLPWLHTRYALISVGLGAASAATLLVRRDWRALAAFVVPAAIAAAAWFGCFVWIYGTPDPSAPYGAYTQMALAHLRPGLPGLLVDQQFGLLSTAPVLVLALGALRLSVRRERPGAWWVSVLVVALAALYTSTVGAYRMWWGGLSAPARFLVPLVLPLAPFIALGWQSLRTRASRHLAMAALVVSLACTTALVVADHGALAYNVRDGRARVLTWASPLVDLVSALPAAHRDPPHVVVHDAFAWAALLAVAWAGWRLAERRGRLTPVASMLTLGLVVVPVASATVRAGHRAPALQPVASQVRYLARRASSPRDVLVAITPPPTGRTRTWFDVELDSRRRTGAADYTLLRIDDLPAGRYRLWADGGGPGARLGVSLGDGRTARFAADLQPAGAAVSVPFVLGVPVQELVVKASREAAASVRRTWIVADEIRADDSPAPATRLHAIGDRVWLLPEDGIYPEADGAWLAGDAAVTVGVTGDGPVVVDLRAGTAPVTVTWTGRASGRLTLGPGEVRTATMTPQQGRLRIETRGGFRPGQGTTGGDQRWLAAWISAR